MPPNLQVSRQSADFSAFAADGRKIPPPPGIGDYQPPLWVFAPSSAILETTSPRQKSVRSLSVLAQAPSCICSCRQQRLQQRTLVAQSHMYFFPFLSCKSSCGGVSQLQHLCSFTHVGLSLRERERADGSLYLSETHTNTHAHTHTHNRPVSPTLKNENG